MKSRRFYAIVAVTVFVLTFALNVRPAFALTLTISNLTCTGLTASGTTNGSLAPVLINVSDLTAGGAFVGTGITQSGSSLPFPYSVNITFISPGVAGHMLQINAFDLNLNMLQIATATIPACSAGATSGTFWNPNDGRVDPHPGDRLAVWCNTSATPPNLDIWGVADDSSGFRLARVSFADLLTASTPKLKGLRARLQVLLQQKTDDTTLAAQIQQLLNEIQQEERFNSLTRNAGRYGSITISVDPQNNFVVMWSGGPYGANGQGDFAKRFQCSFTR